MGIGPPAHQDKISASKPERRRADWSGWISSECSSLGLLYFSLRDGGLQSHCVFFCHTDAKRASHAAPLFFPVFTRYQGTR